MSGDAKSQCKKDAEATYKKTMADADADARQGEGRLQGEKVKALR